MSNDELLTSRLNEIAEIITSEGEEFNEIGEMIVTALFKEAVKDWKRNRLKEYENMSYRELPPNIKEIFRFKQRIVDDSEWIKCEEEMSEEELSLLFD